MTRDGNDVVAEWKSTAFALVQEDSGLATAVALLQSEASRYAVIVEVSGKPVGLVVAGDLERITGEDGIEGDRTLVEILPAMPPLLVVELASASQARLPELALAPQMRLLRHGARGVVVIEDGAITGVLPEELITPYLDVEVLPQNECDRFGSMAGDIVTSVGVVVCARCKTRNTIAVQWDPDRPPWCVNRLEPELGLHRVSPGWT